MVNLKSADSLEMKHSMKHSTSSHNIYSVIANPAIPAKLNLPLLQYCKSYIRGIHKI